MLGKFTAPEPCHQTESDVFFSMVRFVTYCDLEPFVFCPSFPVVPPPLTESFLSPVLEIQPRAFQVVNSFSATESYSTKPLSGPPRAGITGILPHLARKK